MGNWLDQRRGPFEASLREAPQDEGILLMPSTAYLILSRPRSGRVEGRTAAMQPGLWLGAQLLHTL
jgi:hypothetical protein